MKKLLLAIGFFSIAYISNAQNEAILDSFHSFQWVESEWVISDAYVFLDPEADDIVRDRYFYDENGERILSVRAEWLYDTNGTLLQYNEYAYIINTNEWIKIVQRDYLYDAEENVTSIEIYEYSSETFELERDLKFEYFDYTPQGDYQRRDVYITDDNNEWVLASSIGQEPYYTSGDLLDSLVRIDTESDPQTYISARTYKYDSEGNQTKETWWGQYDEMTENFSINFWFESVYEDGLIQSLTQYDYDESVPEGLLQYTNVYEYDEDGNRLFLTNQDWDENEQALINDWRQQNFWRSTVSNENLELSYWNTIWNNKSDYVLDLKIQGLNQVREYKLSIFNMQGQLVHSSPFKNASVINEKFNLGAGSFFVTLQDDEGFRETTKVVLTR